MSAVIAQAPAFASFRTMSCFRRTGRSGFDTSRKVITEVLSKRSSGMTAMSSIVEAAGVPVVAVDFVVVDEGIRGSGDTSQPEVQPQGPGSLGRVSRRKTRGRAALPVGPARDQQVTAHPLDALKVIVLSPA